MNSACEILLIILLFFILFGFMIGFCSHYNRYEIDKISISKKNENFLPVDYSRYNFDSFANKRNGNTTTTTTTTHYGSCGPGCGFQCSNRNCLNFRKKLEYSKYRSEIKMPRALPVGANQSISGSSFIPTPTRGCASNPNGITYLVRENPYGFTTPYEDGVQTYGFCDEADEDNGRYNNTFD